jgi:hypothetical protein
MSISDFDKQLGGVFDTLTNLTKAENGVLAPLDSSDVDVNKVIEDHIYGLLELDELSMPQILMLTALMQGRG